MPDDIRAGESVGQSAHRGGLSRVVAVANQKGGVGKTTTAVSLASGIALRGRPVLLIDLDPQGNATTSLGVPAGSRVPGTYDVLRGCQEIRRATQPTAIKGLALLPAGVDLVGAEVELATMDRRQIRLREAVNALRADVERFDYIFVDCPPSLGLLTINGLAAADGVLVPLQCEFFALEGISNLSRTVDGLRRTLNPTLRIEGIVLTMFDKRNNLADLVARDARSFFKDRVYETMIPRNVRLSEAPSHGKPIALYDPHSPGALAYGRLVDEFLRDRCRANGRALMSLRVKEPRLGRGLAALLGDAIAGDQGSVESVAIDLLEPGPFQPRVRVDDMALGELTESVRAHGILQPLLVRRHPDSHDRFQIVAGERRWRAAQAAGLHVVPALVRDLADGEATAASLVENLQRQDLNAVEEAEGYRRLMHEFSMTQDTLAMAVGKSRSHVANTLRLLNLPAGVQANLRDGKLSAGHARALLAHPDPALASAIVLARGLNVRQTEALARASGRGARHPANGNRVLGRLVTGASRPGDRPFRASRHAGDDTGRRRRRATAHFLSLAGPA